MCYRAEHGCPFSLVCTDCDAGDPITSYDQALVEGWTDITYYPELAMANYVGKCPDCAREEREEWLALYPDEESGTSP